jgi:hypothetical protein
MPRTRAGAAPSAVAQPDLSGALRHRAGEHAAEAHCREQRRQSGEGGRQYSDEAVEEHVLAHIQINVLRGRMVYQSVSYD